MPEAISIIPCNGSSNAAVNGTTATKGSQVNVEELRARLTAHGQEHLLQYWDKLTPDQQRDLAHELSDLDLAAVCRYHKRCVAYADNTAKLDHLMEPLPAQLVGSVARSDSALLAHYESIGLKQISEGKVAVLLLAGGQGTRLGVSYPKGMYNIGLPSGKSLYELQAHRIRKLQQLAAEKTGKEGVIPWYIMASDKTKAETREFFQQHDYFGLDVNNVVFFEQGMLPCMTFDGKIILEDTHHIAFAPDGNGGLYKALSKHNIYDDLARRGVEYVHIYCVDNLLVKMADPLFIGFCVDAGVECGAKVVEKSVATEAVGVVCKVSGVYQVVEYSEITLATAERRNADGRLTFSAGNICNHFLTVDFLRNVIREREDELQHHVAKKKIPHCVDGARVEPDKPNGIKMEKFVFDIFQFAKKFCVWEVLREDEFAPLKNKDGADCPLSCRQSLMSLHTRWLLKAGATFLTEDGSTQQSAIPRGCELLTGFSHSGDSDEPAIVCEVSPLVSYHGEGLEQLVCGKFLVPPVILKTGAEKGAERFVTSDKGEAQSQL